MLLFKGHFGLLRLYRVLNLITGDWAIGILLNLVETVYELLTSLCNLGNQDGGEVAIMMKMHDDFFHNFLLIGVDIVFYDLGANLRLDNFLFNGLFNLLDSILLIKHVFLNPLRVVRDKIGKQKSESNQNVLYNEHSNNKLLSRVFAEVLSKSIQSFRCEDYKTYRVDSSHNGEKLEVLEPAANVHCTHRYASFVEATNTVLLRSQLKNITENG